MWQFLEGHALKGTHNRVPGPEEPRHLTSRGSRPRRVSLARSEPLHRRKASFSHQKAEAPERRELRVSGFLARGAGREHTGSRGRRGHPRVPPHPQEEAGKGGVGGAASREASRGEGPELQAAC